MNNMNIKVLYRVSILFLCTWMLASLSCNKNNTTQVENGSITLTVEDASCIEAWLNIKIKDMTLPQSLSLFENDSLITNLIITTPDTTIFTENLLPKKSYKWQLRGEKEKSNAAAVVTMDTTSHNFTWQTFTFGQHSSSTLYDVAIINENNIWAVGEIYMNDSLGNPDPACYNAVHWNGQSWELIKTGGYGGYPRRSVFAFSENDVWFDGVIKWDGIKYTVHNNGWPLLPNGDGWIINKMWGSSSNDLYAVGNGGNIAHWDGISWKKIESGTDVNLKDIYGTIDGREIWTCGWSNSTGRVSLLKIYADNIESLWDSQTNTTLIIYRGTLLNSLFANGNGEFVLVGGQVLRHSAFYKNQVKLEWVKNFNGSKVLELGNYAYKIKGSNKNNIIAIGDASMIWHFNGATWFKYSELYNLDKRLYGLAVTDKVTVTVGKRYSPGTLGGALLIVGRR